MSKTRWIPLVLGLPLLSSGQSAPQAAPELQQILQRLDRLEAQNQALLDEIRSLRNQLNAPAPASAASPAPPVEERLEVEEQRIAELDQEKIATEHKLPITLTGMLLFNAFRTGSGAGGADNPTLAAASPGPAAGGGTFRQSVIGMKLDGPGIVGGGKLTASAYADFFGGSGGTLNQIMRLRVASIDAVWKNTTVSFALDKPIIAPREPDSLAQVGVSPLTAAGNLWLWQPQVRMEQRVALGSQAGLRLQGGVYQTAEGGTGLSSEYGDSLAKARPGYEGRFEFWKTNGETRRFEIAPGFHASSTRVVGLSAASRIFTVDWLIRPLPRVDFTGTFFHGQNLGVVGGLRQGVRGDATDVLPVQGTGGWAQIKVRIAPRLTFNVFGGQEDDRNRDLESGSIGKNQAYAANLMYRIGSNIVTSFETSQTRTSYVGSGTRVFTHYDLALAYLF